MKQFIFLIIISTFLLSCGNNQAKSEQSEYVDSVITEVEFDSANLTEESYPTLNQIASILKDNPTWASLKVKGHTDSTGPESYNQGLSERRAQAVADYLIAQGVSSSAVSTQGFGESQPIATNNTADGRKANRRVEFEVVK